MRIDKYLINLARQKKKTIVFPEAAFSDRIMQAAKIINKKKIAKLILIGDESDLVLRYKKLEGFTIISPKTSDLTETFAEKLYEIRKEKGLTREQAKELIQNPFYFAVMLVHEGYADGMVGGAEVSTAENLRPALEIIKAKNGFASSSSFFIGKHKRIKLPIFIGDTGLTIKPDKEKVALIAENTVRTMKVLFPHIEPRVAFISFSTKGSAKGEDVDKMREARQIFAEKNPTVINDGELQLDTALVPHISEFKAKGSPIEGKANILIVPDLNVGNTMYKAVQYFGNLIAIGPIIEGLNKPVNDLSRGCTVEDIVILTAVTVLQCE